MAQTTYERSQGTMDHIVATSPEVHIITKGIKASSEIRWDFLDHNLFLVTTLTFMYDWLRHLILNQSRVPLYQNALQ